MTSKTEKSFYNFQRDQLENKTGLFFIFVIGFTFSLFLYLEIAVVFPLILAKVILAWFSVLLIIIEWQIRCCVFSRITPVIHKLYSAMNFRTEDHVGIFNHASQNHLYEIKRSIAFLQQLMLQENGINSTVRVKEILPSHKVDDFIMFVQKNEEYFNKSVLHSPTSHT